MSVFKMKPVPKKPTRETRRFYTTGLNREESIEQIVARLAAATDRAVKVNPKLVGYNYITNSYLLKNLNLITLHRDYFSTTMDISVSVPESIESYKIRMDEYKKEKAIYDKWCEENAGEIAKYKAAQEQIKEEGRRIAAARAEARKARKKERLRKILENTQKKLSKLKAEE